MVPHGTRKRALESDESSESSDEAQGRLDWHENEPPVDDQEEQKFQEPLPEPQDELPKLLTLSMQELGRLPMSKSNL